VSPEREACLFCDIVAGKRAAWVIFQDGASTAFLDHRPLFPGHCLLVPNEHYVTLGDLPSTKTGPFFALAARISRAVEEELGAEGSFVAINNRVSQSVPHLHVHVVPRHKKDGLRGFFWPRQKYKSDEEALTVAASLRRALERSNV
jgi:histidine triad (HIT) family protein